jgi:CheY-like chemotaxis protein
MEMNAKRALCVDDDAATLKLRKFLLETAGYVVVTVFSAVEAMELLAGGTTIDLVLLDYLMPGMKGDELAEKLRKSYPDLRLIAVSAVGQLPPAFISCVDSYVQKGQDPEILLSVMAAVLARPESQARDRYLTPPKTILCVEDEHLQLQLRKMQFESTGFQVLEAQKASAAMEIFSARHVDVVVMDYWLSGTNGTALAEEMKRLHPRTPIVMLSGFASLPGEGVVVDTWLRKAQIEPEELVNQVRRLIDVRANT